MLRFLNPITGILSQFQLLTQIVSIERTICTENINWSFKKSYLQPEHKEGFEHNVSQLLSWIYFTIYDFVFRKMFANKFP